MTTVARNNLWNYIAGLNLSLSDQSWLASKLVENGARVKPVRKSASAPKPYTMEEIHAMIDEAERDFAEGRCVEHENLFRELLEEGNLEAV